MGNRKVPFDKFALPVQGFNIQGERDSKSWFGFTATILFLILVSTLFITGVISMFQRTSVIVSISEQGISTPPPTNIKNLTMAFLITDRYSPLTPLTYGVDYHIVAGLWTWKFDGTPKQLEYSSVPLQVEQCTQEYFGDLADQFDDVANIQDLFCISRSQSDELWTIEGVMGSKVFKNIQFEFRCGPDDTSSCPAGMVSSNVIFYYAESYLDTTNYEKPISYVASAINDRADVAGYHEKHVTITLRDIITDNGFIFEDMTTQTDLMISQGQIITEAVNPVSPGMFSFNIELNNKKIIVNRSYNKIFDVLAITTGIASTIGLAFSILLSPYIQLKAHNDIIKAVAPHRYIEIELKDFVKALFCNKAAKERVKKVLENRKWVIQNFDVIRTIKKWNDVENIKMNSPIDEHFPIHIASDEKFYDQKEMGTPNQSSQPSSIKDKDSPPQ